MFGFVSRIKFFSSFYRLFGKSKFTASAVFYNEGRGSIHNISDGRVMKKYWISLGILMLVATAASAPVLAHDECDDVAQPKPTPAESHGSVALQSQSESRVTIKLFQYQPGRMEVKAGTTVKWMNEDEIFHTVSAGEPGKNGGGFDGVLDGKGKSFSFTFSQPGTYSYYCERHEHMRGEIEVR
jgi:plastocyanin